MDILQQYKQNGFFIKHAVTHAPKDETFSMHIHNTYEIYYFVSGAVEYLVEGASYSLHAGDLLLIRPGEVHKPRITESAKYERYNANFSAAFLHAVDPQSRLLRPFAERPLGQKNRYTAAELSSLPIQKIFHDLCYCTEDAYGKQLKALTFLITLLNAVQDAYNRKSVAEGIQNSREAEIVAYVNAHIAEDISVPRLAKQFYVSASQFNRVFKNATGAAPWSYITAKRLTVAKEKLHAGMPAREAASAAGFNDYSVFYRAYIKQFGHAPTARKQDAF